MESTLPASRLYGVCRLGFLFCAHQFSCLEFVSERMRQLSCQRSCFDLKSTGNVQSLTYRACGVFGFSMPSTQHDLRSAKNAATGSRLCSVNLRGIPRMEEKYETNLLATSIDRLRDCDWLPLPPLCRTLQQPCRSDGGTQLKLGRNGF